MNLVFTHILQLNCKIVVLCLNYLGNTSKIHNNHKIIFEF